jgi:hypothetical protein
VGVLFKRISEGENKPAAGSGRTAADGVPESSECGRAICSLALTIFLLALAAVPARARFSFSVGLTTSSQWSDNVYSASENEEEDISYTVIPNILLEYFAPRGSLFVSLSASRNRYRRLKDLDRDSFSSSIDGTYHLSRRTTISFTNSFTYTQDVTTQTALFEDVMTEAGIISAPTRRETVANQLDNTIQVTLLHDFSARTSLNTWIRRRDNVFDNDEFDDSDTTSFQANLTHDVNQRDRFSFRFYTSRHHFGDNEVDSGRARAIVQYLHRQNARTEYTLLFQLERVNDGRPVDDLIFKSRTVTLECGVLHHISRRWTLDLGVGISSSRRSGDLAVDEKPKDRGTQYRCELSRTTRRSILTFRASNTYNPGVRYGFGTRFFAVDYVRDITPHLKWTATLSVSKNERDRAGGIDNDTSVFSSSFIWTISDEADVSVQYSHVDQESKGEEASNVKRNTIFISLNLRYAVNR